MRNIPTIMTTNICKPANVKFILSLIKNRITSIRIELGELTNTKSLYKSYLSHHIDELNEYSQKLNRLPKDAVKCAPVKETNYTLPSMGSSVDCDIVKKLIGLLNLLTQPEDKIVTDTILKDICVDDILKKVDADKKKEIFAALDTIITKYKTA